MESPITGKLMALRAVRDEITYRKIKAKYIRYYWECPDTKEQFTTTEMDEAHLNQIQKYWQSTRTPRKEKTKTEKVLMDELNKYKSWLQQETQSKMGRGNPNLIRETELKAKIELLIDLKNKL